MKYIVMECHGGYAVLMDEAARFVKAANRHYTVGQTVTDPILMEENKEKTPSRNITVIKRFAAAAASIAVFAGASYGYYYQNLKPHSSVIICSASDICLNLNKKGHVISVTSDDPAGEAIIREYNYKGKDKLKVAGDILEIEMAKGMLSSGDSVRMYVDTEDPENCDVYKTELEDGMKGLDLNISVCEIGAQPAVSDPVPPPIQDQPAPEKKDEAPAKPAETAGVPGPGSENHPDAPAPPDPAKDGHKDKEGPAAPPQPAHSDDAPAPAAPDDKAEDPPPPPVDGDKPAPEAPGEDTPQPPAPAAKNDDKPTPPSPPVPAEQGDEKTAVRLTAAIQPPAGPVAAPIPPEPNRHPPVPEQEGSPDNLPAPEAPDPIDHPVAPEAEGPLS
ncbi:MAG: hypothetical protein J5501_03810 [Ruminococcus sp.]|nr:hypothetical protein [Ruminococcus sp.]